VGQESPASSRVGSSVTTWRPAVRASFSAARTAGRHRGLSGLAARPMQRGGSGDFFNAGEELFVAGGAEEG